MDDSLDDIHGLYWRWLPSCLHGCYGNYEHSLPPRRSTELRWAKSQSMLYQIKSKQVCNKTVYIPKRSIGHSKMSLVRPRLGPTKNGSY